MGDSHCSKIAIMQLFYELKEQFPALPDHIISQCIAQNSYDRPTCEQSLRNIQDVCPPLGKFPPVHNAMTTHCVVYRNPLKFEEQHPRPCRPVSLDIQKTIFYEPYYEFSPVSTSTLALSSTSDESSQIIGYESEPNLRPRNDREFRSCSSISLTLRPPSSKPQTPIEISSQGSNSNSSSSDPQSFQSHLNISIGPSSSAQAKHPMNLIRPKTLTPLVPNTIQQSKGLDAGFLNQSIKPTETMSEPTTPSKPCNKMPSNFGSLPTTPTKAANLNLPISSLLENQLQIRGNVEAKPLTIDQKQRIENQLLKKNKLAQALQAEKEKLERMKEEIKSLSQPESYLKSFDIKQRLRNNIYRLQLECDRLSKEIDSKSEQKVPLGETNEEFYRSIYTGQKIKRSASRVPPIPSQPPVWQAQDVAGNSRSSPNIPDNDKEERLGPPWICSMCTFANYPLINSCEQCNMPRLYCVNKPGTAFNIQQTTPSRQPLLTFSANIGFNKMLLNEKQDDPRDANEF